MIALPIPRNARLDTGFLALSESAKFASPWTLRLLPDCTRNLTSSESALERKNLLVLALLSSRVTRLVIPILATTVALSEVSFPTSNWPFMITLGAARNSTNDPSFRYGPLAISRPNPSERVIRESSAADAGFPFSERLPLTLP